MSGVIESGGSWSARSIAVAAIVAGAALGGWWLWLAADEPVDASSGLSAAEQRQREILNDRIGKPGDADVERLYASLNEKYFDGELPAIPVAWESRLEDVGALEGRRYTLEGMFGRVGTRTIILLHPKLRDDERALRRTLSHEMVHAAMYVRGHADTGHGPVFQATLKRLADAGAFEGLVATHEEQQALRAWIDAESARLDQESAALDSTFAQLDKDRTDVERAVTAMEARLAAAASTPQSSGPSQAELDAVNAQRDLYNDRAARANERADRHRASIDALNREIERYNLMVAYPDGLDERIAAKKRD